MKGIYFLANDRVVDWLYAAVQSVRAHGCALPICIIPYNEQTGQVRALAARFDLQVLDDSSFVELDQIAERIENRPVRSGSMFRKFACFWGPYEHFLYLDADIIALMDLSEILEKQIADAAFWYFGLSEGEVYKPGTLLNELKAKGNARCFNAGAFASFRNVLTPEQVVELSKQAEPVQAQFVEMTGDQPFLNYCIHQSEITAQSATSCITDLYDWNWADSVYGERSDMFTVADRDGSFQGKRFPFVHWAGIDLTSYMPQRELFLKYRLMDAPQIDRLRYTWTDRARPVFGNLLRSMKRSAAG